MQNGRSSYSGSTMFDCVSLCLPRFEIFAKQMVQCVPSSFILCFSGNLHLHNVLRSSSRESVACLNKTQNRLLVWIIKNVRSSAYLLQSSYQNKCNTSLNNCFAFDGSVYDYEKTSKLCNFEYKQQIHKICWLLIPRVDSCSILILYGLEEILELQLITWRLCFCNISCNLESSRGPQKSSEGPHAVSGP